MEPKIVYIQNEVLSHFLPRGSIILCSCVLAVVLLCNLLERWLLPAAYPHVWADLAHHERRRRSFTYLHVGVCVMVCLCIFGAFPVFGFLVGRARVSDVLFKRVTYGDYLLVLSQVYSAYYVFEPSFRTKFASTISIAHHIGLLVVIQMALALFGDVRKYPEAILEFYMCMVWGIYIYFFLYLTLVKHYGFADNKFSRHF